MPIHFIGNQECWKSLMGLKELNLDHVESSKGTLTQPYTIGRKKGAPLLETPFETKSKNS